MAPPPRQVALAQKYGKMYGVDPKLLLAIGGHETQWGATGAGRPSQGGYVLGYGVTDSGILSKYAGVETQYRMGAKLLAGWGVHTINDVEAGKAKNWATDPAWERGVAQVYKGLGGKLDASTWDSPAGPSRPPDAVPTPVPGQMTPQDYRKQAALTGLQGIVQGQKPTDTLAGTVESFQAHPIAPMSPAPVQQHEEGSSLGQQIVKVAAQQLGQPYVWGGESRKEGGFDCSGLVDFAMRQAGYDGPRLTTETIKGMGHSVMGQNLAPGDLILANGGEHVVIYAGGGKVISAPHTGAKVRYQKISDYKVTDIRRPY